VNGYRRHDADRPRVRTDLLRSIVGLTLIELLLASSIAVITLAAAWPWFWNVARAARSVQATSQAHGQAAYTTRAIAEEMRLADGLVPLASDLVPETAVCVRHHHPNAAAEEVVIAWDPSRQVVWRKARGTYLSDHVSAFRITYFAGTGLSLDPDTLTSATALATVTRISVRITVTAGSQAVTEVSDHSVGPR